MMPTDAYKGYQRGLTAPASNAFAITPADGADLAFAARALYVGGAGDIALRTLEGTDVTFRALNAGTVLPVGAVRVAATGTTAQNIVGLV